MDSEDAFDEYLEIDQEFIKFGTFLFNEIPDKDELLKFLVQPRANGGLALQLPGFFFQHFNLVNRNQEDIEGGYIQYRKAIQQWKKQQQKPQGEIYFAPYTFTGYR